jgi:hypothetical protein
LRVPTERNLKVQGYEGYVGIYFKPENYQNPSVVDHKTKSREAIEKAGYDILLNIGDQDSDLKGGHALKTFKIPNPAYYVR